MLNAKSCLNISAGLLLLTSIVSASQAQAQSVNVPMNGNVPGSCTFGAVTAGTLAKHSSPYAVMGATPTFAGAVGSAGRVTVTCVGSSALTVAAPVGSGPVGFTPTVVQAVVQKGNSSIPSDLASASTGGVFEPGGPWNTTNPSMPLPPGPTVLNVNMVAGLGMTGPGPIPGPLPIGNYNYTINLSITGN